MALVVFLAVVIAIPWMAMHAQDLLMLCVWAVPVIVVLFVVLAFVPEVEHQLRKPERRG